MLQRPQTLFFFGAFVCLLLTLVFPVCKYTPIVEAKGKPDFVVHTSSVKIVVNPETLPEYKERLEKGFEQDNKVLDERLKKQNFDKAFLAGMIGMLILSGLAFVAMLLFKNRKLQIRIGWVVMILSLFVSIILFIGSKMGVEILVQNLKPYVDLEWETSYGLATFLPAIAAVLTFFAIYFVRKDDNLIKSVDRIR